MNNQSDRTDFLTRSRWGAMVHFLSTHAGHVEALDTSEGAWERRVNAVDVDRLVGTLADTGAGHLILTVGQNSGYYCAPNDTYEDALGVRKGTYCTERDLMKEVASACHKRGMAFIAYATCHPPAGLAESAPLFGPFPADGGRKWSPPPELRDAAPRDENPTLPGLRSKWWPVLEEWARRWEKDVDGWWMDGGYYREMFAAPEGPQLEDALRAGNANAAIATAKGHRSSLEELYPFEDYTAGECIERLWVGGWFGADHFQLLPERIGHARTHILTFLGEFWGRGKLALPVHFAASYTKLLLDQGVAMTWDIPVTRDGEVPDEIRRALAGIGEAQVRTSS